MQMIRTVSATCILCIAAVWWGTFSGGVELSCHCATTAECSVNRYCPNGCENGWYGPGCQIGNVALQKRATQSTTYPESGSNYEASKAVDGALQWPHCTHTVPGYEEAWWYVELDNQIDFVIQNVTLRNRDTGEFGRRLSNFSIVYTTSLTNIPPNFNNWTLCAYSGGPQRNLLETYSCRMVAVAKRVGIRLLYDFNLLTLCEVVVNGYKKRDCPPGYTGPGCLLRDCTVSPCNDACNDTNSCFYSLCPNSTVVLPTCWIEIPSARYLNLTSLLSCNIITIRVGGRIKTSQGGSYFLDLEIKSEDSISTLQSEISDSGLVNISFTVSTLERKVLEFRTAIRWCTKSSRVCYFGPLSNWSNVILPSYPKSFCSGNSVLSVMLPCRCARDLQCKNNGFCPHGCADGWIGPGCQVGNFAFNKTADQSSTYDGDWDGNKVIDYSASMAVDGRAQGSSTNGAVYCTHTQSTTTGPAWWYVVLDRVRDVVIQHVTLTSRRKPYGGDNYERLRNFSVVYTSMIDSGPPDSKWTTCFNSSEPQATISSQYSCRGNATGKKLGIQLRNDPSSNILTLCEVEVEGYYKVECSDGFTGPGCLLHDCRRSECRDGCGDYDGCKYSTCPDADFLPPYCWIRLPSLRRLTSFASATCNSIVLSIDRKMIDGDLNITHVTLEIESESQKVMHRENITITNVPITEYVFAAAGDTHSLRMIPHWCNQSFGVCFPGPSSNWTRATTASRNVTLEKNDSCLFVSVTSTVNNCEQVTFLINCTDHYNASLFYGSNGSALCELPSGAYRCFVFGNVNGYSVYEKTLDLEIGERRTISPTDRSQTNVVTLMTSDNYASMALKNNVFCAVCTNHRRLGLRNDPAGYLVGEELTDAYCTENQPLITWRCTSTSAVTAEWIAVKNDSCPHNDEMERLSRVNVTYDTLSSYLSEVINVTSSSPGATFGVAVADISYGSLILSNAISLVIQEPQKVSLADVIVTVPGIVSKILEAPTASLAASNTSSSISRNVEAFLSVSATVLPENSTVVHFEQNLVVQMTSDPEIMGIEAISDSTLSAETVRPVKSGDSQSSRQQAEALVYFAPEAKDLRKSFAVFNNSKLFQGKKMHPAIDRILAAQLTKTVMHPELVTVLFKLPALQDQTASYDEVECGFWNFIENDWSTFGCNRKPSSYNRISCSCNHTTNFAVLFRVHEVSALQLEHSFALSTITRIGLSLSVGLLLFVIISFSCIRALRRTQDQKVLFNVSLSVCLLDAAFLIGIERTENETACIAFAALIHVFLLTSFAWMSVEASFHYLKLVEVFGAMPSHFFIKVAIPAWGLPPVIVSALLIADYRLYNSTQDGLCWIQKRLMHFAVILPVSLCIAYNGVIFAMIARSLLSTHSQSVRSTMSKSERLKLRTRASFAVFVLLGLTWTFGYFALERAETAFSYLFCLFNSIQGALIALLHCILGKLLPRELRRILRRTSTSKEQSSGVAASTGTFKTTINQRKENTKL